MSSKKTADLSPSLVAVKGQATPVPPASPPRLPASAPLNFKVSVEFRRRFRQRAAGADLRLNELLREALDAWEQKRGLT
ncbi:MAG: hypothetical protein IPL99_23995 [Candidatus Competibacteraceae bacterium]|nr:hypothetical protein [Candidatus Competibacteraceae bacterium]